MVEKVVSAADIDSAASQRGTYGSFVFLIVLAGIAINGFLGVVGSKLNGLLFLDTIGTAIAAVALGPWWGAFVGAATNLLIGQLPCKQQYFNYLIVNVFCGLAWGYLARSWPKLLSSDGRYPRLFFTLILFGASVGLISSVMSLFTTFNFVWYLSSIDPDTFRRWHLTDEYYRWLLKSQVDLQRGTLLSVVYRDIIAILPDKIVSISIATFILYYAVPHRFLLVRGADRQNDLFFSRLGLILFTTLFTFCVGLLVTRGNVSIDPETCRINGSRVIAPQIVLWLVPLVVACCLLCLTFRTNAAKYLTANPVVDPDRFEQKPKKYVQTVYKDVVGILAAVFALIIALKQQRLLDPDSTALEIANLLSDGFGIAAFFALALFVPGFLLRLFGVGPSED